MFNWLNTLRIFITGTDTNIGKTLVCSWLCLQAQYSYFKPIQTGVSEGRDTETVQVLSGAKTYPEIFAYKAPLSPHVAAVQEQSEIILDTIILPNDPRILVEGAGGLLVPLNKEYLMIDMIKHLDLPVILVTSGRLGTINHTLLSLEALERRAIEILGVIMNGEEPEGSSQAIEYYGKTKILAHLPSLKKITRKELLKIPLTPALKALLAPGFNAT